MTPAFDAIAPHPDGVDADDELIHERAYVVRAYRNGVDTDRAARRRPRPEAARVVHHRRHAAAHGPPHDRRPHHRGAVAGDHRGQGRAGDPSARRRARGSRTTTATSSACRSPVASPTRCASCSAGRAAAPTRRRCCRRWRRWPIQSMWSFRMAQARGGDAERSVRQPRSTARCACDQPQHLPCVGRGQRARRRACGTASTMEVPLWITKRFDELGRDPETFGANPRCPGRSRSSVNRASGR